MAVGAAKDVQILPPTLSGTYILGLLYEKAEKAAETDPLIDTINAMIEERTQARKEKNWAKADEIRNKLREMGIVLEDTPQGVKWHKVQE